MHAELRTTTAEQTREIGAVLGAALRAGDVIALTGELGAGKTTLVQGMARGLGIEDAIVSPTFTLVREYRGRLHLIHADVYRLERLQDVIDLGLEEELADDGVLVVEWGDAVEALLPPDHLTIELTTDPGGEDDTRTLVLSADGGTWEERLAGISRTGATDEARGRGEVGA
jgi:tRNA threonylcarbamoyladenosine biosynthesis protein TsaE